MNKNRTEEWFKKLMEDPFEVTDETEWTSPNGENQNYDALTVDEMRQVAPYHGNPHSHTFGGQVMGHSHSGLIRHSMSHAHAYGNGHSTACAVETRLDPQAVVEVLDRMEQRITMLEAEKGIMADIIQEKLGIDLFGLASEKLTKRIFGNKRYIAEEEYTCFLKPAPEVQFDNAMSVLEKNNG